MTRTDLPEPVQKWVAALRSGEYKQGMGRLREGDRFCCLGVLCDLYAKEHGISWNGPDGMLRGFHPYLPLEVARWAGLRRVDGLWYSQRGSQFLTNKNDNGRSFKQIANMIEHNWERLSVEGGSQEN